MSAFDDTHADQEIAFHGTITDYWSYSQIRDYLLVMPGLSHTELRLYLLLRSMVNESAKYMRNQRMRRMTIDQLCFLLPGPNDKPTSVSTMYQLLASLEGLDLVVPVDALEDAGAKGLKGKDKAARGILRAFQVKDLPPEAYTGWRNAWDKLDAYREDWRTSQPQPPTHLTVPGPGGMVEVHQVHGGAVAEEPFQKTGTGTNPDEPTLPFQKTGKPFQKTGKPFQKTGTIMELTSGNAPLKEGSLRRSSSSSAQVSPVPAQAAPVETEEEDKAAPSKTSRETAVALVTSLPWPVQKRPGTRELNGLVALVVAALEQGWTPEALTGHLVANYNPQRAVNPAGIFRKHLNDLPEPPSAADLPAEDIPWCGQCDGKHTRMVEVEDDFIHCQTCHPVVVARSRRAQKETAR